MAERGRGTRAHFRFFDFEFDISSESPKEVIIVFVIIFSIIGVWVNPEAIITCFFLTSIIALAGIYFIHQQKKNKYF